MSLKIVCKLATLLELKWFVNQHKKRMRDVCVSLSVRGDVCFVIVDVIVWYIPELETVLTIHTEHESKTK